MKLSKRLNMVASFIEEDIVDIGCDHGFLDIFLALNKNIKIKAIDISENALKSAIDNAKKYKVYEKIEFIVSDGIKNVDIKNETLVITGMGAYTIIDILSNKKIKENSLILSAHNNLNILRKYLVKNGYGIKNEVAVFDKKWYVIMKCVKMNISYTEIDYEVGPIVKNDLKYLEYLLCKEKEISNKKNIKTKKLLMLEKQLEILKN